MRKHQECFAFVFILFIIGLTGILQPALAAAAPPAEDSALPLYFVENHGQAAPSVRFHARAESNTFFFLEREVLLTLLKGRAHSTSSEEGHDARLQAAIVTIRFPGACEETTLEGTELQDAKFNFYTGSESKEWRENVPSYGRVVYRDLYDGIDLHYRGDQGRIKYEFVVAPGADPGRIRIQYEGVRSIRRATDGSLLLETATGALKEETPYVYQLIEGREKPVEAILEFAAKGQQWELWFDLGDYDSEYSLVVDPVLSYSTYLGGSDSEMATSVAIGTAGNILVAGHTASTDFPTSSATQAAHGGGSYDCFVSKLNASGTALLYSTYLGGAESDYALDLVINNDGKTFVVGYTRSTDFPTVHAYQNANAGGIDTFVAQLSRTGTLRYSTYLGGAESDYGQGVDLWWDLGDHIVVTGYTGSSDFPVANAYQSSLAGDFDAFVAVFNALDSWTTLFYSTYVGGAERDRARERPPFRTLKPCHSLCYNRGEKRKGLARCFAIRTETTGAP